MVLICIALTAMVLAACNPLGLRDSDDERIQLVADMSDAAESENWDEVRSYLVPDASDLPDSAIRTAAWEAVLTTTYSPSEWIIDEYEDWALVRYPEDALSGTVVREVDNDWFVDPGQFRKTRARLVEDVSHEFHTHSYQVETGNVTVDVEGYGASPSNVVSPDVRSIVRSRDNDLDIALTLRFEQGGRRAQIDLDDIQWQADDLFGAGNVVWSSAPLTEDQSALDLRARENSSGMQYAFDLTLEDVPADAEYVTMTIPGVFIEGFDDPDADERELEIQIAIIPESNPDFDEPDSIPWSIELTYADMPFDVLVPTYIPFDYEAPSLLSDSPSDAVAQYMTPPEPHFVRIVQSEAVDSEFSGEGEPVEFDGVGEAYFLDDGEQSQLKWVDEEAGIEVLIETGEGEDRQPLEELIRIAEGME